MNVYINICHMFVNWCFINLNANTTAVLDGTSREALSRTNHTWLLGVTKSCEFCPRFIFALSS